MRQPTVLTAIVKTIEKGMSQGNYYVYEHINKYNGKRYIGITKQKPEARWKSGKGYKNKCPHFWNAIQKYGWDAFEHNIIASGLEKDDACKFEIQLIEEYMTQDQRFGYNIFEGGQAPSIPDDIRQKMSIAAKKRQPIYGRACSTETRKKIGDAQRGRKFTEEHKKNISNAKRGRQTQPCSDSKRKKISDSHAKKKIICLETNMIYPSIQQCSRDTGFIASAICAVCRGRNRSVHGYHFSYCYDSEKPND